MKLNFLLQSGKKHTESVLNEKTFSLFAGGMWPPLLQRCPGPAAHSVGQSRGQTWRWHSFPPCAGRRGGSSCLVSQLQGCNHSLLGVGGGQQNVEGSGENVPGTFNNGKS